MVEALVDSLKFLGFATKRLVRAWIERERSNPRPAVWTPLPRPLAECTVAMISTAGLAMAGDRPFDREGERRNPWWGDPSHRVIPRDADTGDVRVWHTHVNNAPTEQDLNCSFPLARLREMEHAAEIGRTAASHYSFQGYLLDPTILLEQAVPAMIELMRRDEVDVVLLAPY